MKHVIILVLGAMMAYILVSCGQSEAKQNNPAEKAVPVKTVVVKKELAAKPIHTSGKLASTEEIKLSFLTGGIIDELRAEEGQYVSKNQLLAKLKLDEIEARNEQAKQTVEKTRRDLSRVINLYNDKVATLENKQDLETKLAVDKANLDIAEYNLKHSYIYAPENGRILKRFAEENELTGQGMPVYLFGTTGKGWIIRVGVSDKDVINLKKNDPAEVKFDPYPNATFRAFVSEIAEFANPVNGTYEVELTMKPSLAEMKSGFVASVTLFPSGKNNAYVIPTDALVEADGTTAYVFIPDTNKRVKKREVNIMYINGDLAYIRNSLYGINKVIRQGSEYLREESHVKIISENGGK